MRRGCLRGTAAPTSTGTKPPFWAKPAQQARRQAPGCPFLLARLVRGSGPLPSGQAGTLELCNKRWRGPNRARSASIAGQLNDQTATRVQQAPQSLFARVIFVRRVGRAAVCVARVTRRGLANVEARAATERPIAVLAVERYIEQAPRRRAIDDLANTHFVPRTGASTATCSADPTAGQRAHSQRFADERPRCSEAPQPCSACAAVSELELPACPHVCADSTAVPQVGRRGHCAQVSRP